jgi:hypothetical protein
MSSPQRKFTAVDLIPGKSYRVLKSFEDYDGFSHPVGEQWRYIDKSFLPYEDGLTLKIELNGQLTGLRLQWRDDRQAPIIDDFSNYVQEL